MMKTSKILAILILGILLVSGPACGGGPEATPTPTATPTPIPTLPPAGCAADRDAVQTAIDGYYEAHGEWPTADGQPGDIEWGKLVPDFLDGLPYTYSTCDWSVNSDPAGTVCVGWGVSCIPCSCQCGTRCAE